MVTLPPVPNNGQQTYELEASRDAIKDYDPCSLPFIQVISGYSSSRCGEREVGLEIEELLVYVSGQQMIPEEDE